MSAVSSLFHIVINTLRRELTIPDDESEQSCIDMSGQSYRVAIAACCALTASAIMYTF